MPSMSRSSPAVPRGAALLLALAAAAPCHALYKVVGPDGKVTYTDRQPSSREGRVSALGERPAPAGTATVLPPELRDAVNRYPVTLYTASGACEPCDAARALLRGRGIPHNERQVISAEDGEALQRLSGGRDAPTLAIGSQILRGLAAETWQAYLDSAGYPRESVLPAGYQYPAPAPLTQRREAAPAPAEAPAPAPAPAPAAAPPPAAEGPIRF